MPIIHKVFALPKRRTKISPCLRECTLCHKLGAHAHGFYLRYPPVEGQVPVSGMIRVPRFWCTHCRRTFSLLPFLLVRRCSAPLPVLIFVAETKWKWGPLSDALEIALNTLWAWKRLGKLFLEKIPLILELPGATWETLTRHLSRLQYPGGPRKPDPTIP